MNALMAAAACATFGLSTCPEPFDAQLPAAADMLQWDPPTRIVGFRNTYRLYQGDVFRTLGAEPHPLPPMAGTMPPIHYSMEGEERSLDDYLRRESVVGMLILKAGRVAYEYYGGGNTDKTLWTSRSVAKSVVSILVGMAIKEKLIGSVDDQVTHYLPALNDTAWAGVTLRNLLQHTSGVAWNENYADPASDFGRLTKCEAGPAPYECVLALIRSLKRKPGVKPGAVWSYNTAGAWLVGRVLEQATGMTIAHYLETRLWSRYAMQSDGIWEALVKDRVDMGGHGFNATLRDWGRFGLFVADGGKLTNGEQLLPKDWLTQSTTWSHGKGTFGYQWWYVGTPRTSQHTFWAEGIYGQVIAIDPVERVVMVQWSTWQQAEKPDALYDEQAVFFDAVSHALHPTTTSTP